MTFERRGSDLQCDGVFLVVMRHAAAGDRSVVFLLSCSHATKPLCQWLIPSSAREVVLLEPDTAVSY